MKNKPHFCIQFKFYEIKLRAVGTLIPPQTMKFSSHWYFFYTKIVSWENIFDNTVLKLKKVRGERWPVRG